MKPKVHEMQYLIYSVEQNGWWMGRGEGVVHREKYAYRFPPDANSLNVAKDVGDIIYPAPESVAELEQKLEETTTSLTAWKHEATELLAEVSALGAVVDRLPNNGEGRPFTPGQVSYFPADPKAVRVEVIEVGLDYINWRRKEGERLTTDKRLNTHYSTRAAAEAAANPQSTITNPQSDEAGAQ